MDKNYYAGLIGSDDRKPLPNIICQVPLHELVTAAGIAIQGGWSDFPSSTNPMSQKHLYLWLFQELKS